MSNEEVILKGKRENKWDKCIIVMDEKKKLIRKCYRHLNHRIKNEYSLNELIYTFFPELEIIPKPIELTRIEFEIEMEDWLVNEKKGFGSKRDVFSQELIDGEGFYAYMIPEEKTKLLKIEEFGSIVGQVLVILEFLQKQMKFTHYDLHCSNVMIVPIDPKISHVLYDFGGDKQFLFSWDSNHGKTEKFLPVFIDLEFAYSEMLQKQKKRYFGSVALQNHSFFSNTYSSYIDVIRIVSNSFYYYNNFLEYRKSNGTLPTSFDKLELLKTKHDEWLKILSKYQISSQGYFQEKHTDMIFEVIQSFIAEKISFYNPSIVSFLRWVCNNWYSIMDVLLVNIEQQDIRLCKQQIPFFSQTSSNNNNNNEKIKQQNNLYEHQNFLIDDLKEMFLFLLLLAIKNQFISLENPKEWNQFFYLLDNARKLHQKTSIQQQINTAIPYLPNKSPSSIQNNDLQKSFLQTFNINEIPIISPEIFASYVFRISRMFEIAYFHQEKRLAANLEKKICFEPFFNAQNAFQFIEPLCSINPILFDQSILFISPRSKRVIHIKDLSFLNDINAKINSSLSLQKRGQSLKQLIHIYAL